MIDELRKLAEAAIDAYTRINLDDEHFDVGSQADIDAVNAFDAATSPTAVLALIDRIEELERMKMDECDAGFCRSYEAERDEAREAVKRLAGALFDLLHGCSVDAPKNADEALADPVVRRIVEGE
jgi:hypothetical protein